MPWGITGAAMGTVCPEGIAMNPQSSLSLQLFLPGPRAAALFFFLSCTLVPSVGAEALYSHLWGGFSTSMAGRSSQQRGNAARAALDLDGAIIPSGGILGFNERVGARDSMKGYLPAPVINDRGGLSDFPGGGICQLATTIYNAALEAGMEIVERHPHSRAVGYVPPGRDATILSWRKDLRLRNPHGAPLLIRVSVNGERMTVGFWSVEERPFRVVLHSDIQPVEPEAVVSGAGEGMRGPAQQGGKGYSVITRRSMIFAGETREEVLSRDFYPPPSRILAGEGD